MEEVNDALKLVSKALEDSKEIDYTDYPREDVGQKLDGIIALLEQAIERLTKCST